MSENMVERVARASAFARRSRHDQARDADHYWQHLGDLTQQAELASARAAIEAMRSPTEAMVQAGSEAAELQWCDLEIGYPPMIDAALKP